MAEPRRVRVPRVPLGSKGDILDVLVADSEADKTFATLADALAFAAAIGSHYKRHVPPDQIEFGKGDPIRFSVFEAREYETVFDVLAVAHTGDVAVLGSDQESMEQRVGIFESYAAGGLIYLAQQLQGQVDVLPTLLFEVQAVIEGTSVSGSTETELRLSG